MWILSQTAVDNSIILCKCCANNVCYMGKLRKKLSCNLLKTFFLWARCNVCSVGAFLSNSATYRLCLDRSLSYQKKMFLHSRRPGLLMYHCSLIAPYSNFAIPYTFHSPSTTVISPNVNVFSYNVLILCLTVNHISLHTVDVYLLSFSWFVL